MFNFFVHTMKVSGVQSNIGPHWLNNNFFVLHTTTAHWFRKTWRWI